MYFANFGYLMQRCTLKENKIGREHFNVPLSVLLDFDYMGAAEFEFGAFRNKFLCNLTVDENHKWLRFDDFQFRLAPQSGFYTSRNKVCVPVFVYVNSDISDADIAAIKSKLTAMVEHNYQPKEYNVFIRGEFRVSASLYREFELDGLNEGIKRKIISEVRENILLDYSSGAVICFGEKKLPQRLESSIKLSLAAYKEDN